MHREGKGPLVIKCPFTWLLVNKAEHRVVHCAAQCRQRILGITVVIKCPCTALLPHKAKQGCGMVFHTRRGKVPLPNKGNHRGNHKGNHIVNEVFI